MITSSLNTICDVHRILDYDTSKRICNYCGMCDAWICTECQSRWDRRLRAAVKRKMEPGYRGLHNYEELASGGHENEPSTDSGTNA